MGTKESVKNQQRYEQDILLLDIPIARRFKGFDVGQDHFAAELLFAYPIEKDETCLHGSVKSTGEMIVPQKTTKKVSEFLREEYVSLWRETSPTKRGYRTQDYGDRIDLMNQHFRHQAEIKILEKFKNPDEKTKQQLTRLGLKDDDRKLWVKNLEVVARQANIRFAQNFPENGNSLLVLEGKSWIDIVDELYKKIGHNVRQRKSSDQYLGIKWSEMLSSTIDNKNGDKTVFEKNLAEADEILNEILSNKEAKLQYYHGEDTTLNDFQKCLEIMWNDIPGRGSDNSISESGFRSTVAAIRFAPESILKAKDYIVLLMNRGTPQAKVVLAWIIRQADKSQKLIDDEAPFTQELSMSNADIGIHWAAKMQAEPQIMVTEADKNTDWWTVMTGNIRQAYEGSPRAPFVNEAIQNYTRRDEYNDPTVLSHFLHSGYRMSWLPVERDFIWALYHNPKALVTMMDELKDAITLPYEDGPRFLDLCCRVAEFGVKDELIRTNPTSTQ